jgi:hypothetical protein
MSSPSRVLASGGAECRLTLLLPATLALLVPPGRHAPCLIGCLLTVGPGGLMTIDGPSREKVFEQADRFLRVLLRRNPPPPMSIAATMTSRLGVSDGWQVIINAEISFAPTSIEATVFPPEIENSGNVVRITNG